MEFQRGTLRALCKTRLSDGVLGVESGHEAREDTAGRGCVGKAGRVVHVICMKIRMPLVMGLYDMIDVW